jgi:hypothetical protein
MAAHGLRALVNQGGTAFLNTVIALTIAAPMLIAPKLPVLKLYANTCV